jgi:phosphotransferase system enzyme I (PtsI)
MANDPLLIEDAEARIARGEDAYHAYKKAAEKVIAQFQTMSNQYMKNRIVDIEDATDRVLAAIVDTEYEQALTFSEPRILILTKMKPSILYHCQKPSVIGFVSAEGAYDQHSGLIARTFNLPGLIVKEIKEKVHMDDWVLLDADHGVLTLNPTDEIIKEYQEGKTVKL